MLRESQILNVTLSTLPLSNVWKNLVQTRVNVKNILMFIKNARKRRGKLGWNAIEAGPSSHELLLGDPSPLYPTIVSNRLNFELIWSGDPSLVA